MKTEEALAVCEETVRRFDPDRYLASLFAPAEVRPLLFALYAFNHEVACAGERSSEPLLGAVRLQWWREALEEARERRPRAHPAAVGLAEVFACAAPRTEYFESLLDAREFDVQAATFPDRAAFESYCEATSSGLMRIAAQIAGSEESQSDYLRHAGIAYAITGLLRAIPFHASRGKVFLPDDLLAAENISAQDVLAGRSVVQVKAVLRRLAGLAREHVAPLRAYSPDSKTLRAALPAALAPLYLSRLDRPKFDPFRDVSDVPLFRRQLALLRAVTFRRI